MKSCAARREGGLTLPVHGHPDVGVSGLSADELPLPRPLRTGCRRCGAALPYSRGQARVYCGVDCRRATENELRALRHELEDAHRSVTYYSRLAVRPLPGMATPEHSRREIVRYRAHAVEIERQIDALQHGRAPDDETACVSTLLVEADASDGTS